MALLEILHFPDPRLRNNGKEITEFDSSLQKLIDDMYETMYDAKGVGLAATQVGIDKQIAVIDISETKDQPFVIINPTIISSSDLVTFNEGCLSVPYHYDKLQRFNKVKVKALDRFGKPFEIEGEELLAECLQHEIDHLKGKLYIDYLSNLKRQIIRQKLEKMKRRSRQHD